VRGEWRGSPDSDRRPGFDDARVGAENRSGRNWSRSRCSPAAWFFFAVLLVVVGVVFELFVYDGGPGVVTLVFAVVGAVVCLIQGGSRSSVMRSAAGARVA